jgi:serine/threonine-protein kinase RIO1
MLAIWLSYARSQAKYGTIEEARVSFRRIQNQQLGVRDARFYLAVAEVEQNNNLAIALQALKIGIDQKAEPLEKLKSALLHLENRQSSDPSCRAGEVLLDDSSLSTEKKLNIGAGFPIRIPPLQPVSNHSQRKRNEQTDMSPKCLKTETVAIVNSPLAHNEILTNTADSNIVELSSQKRGTYSSLAIDMNDSVLAGPHNQVSNVGRLKRSSSELGYVNLHPNEPQKASQHMNNKKKKGFQQALFEHHQPMKQAAISTASDALPRDVLLINSKAVVSSTSDKKDRVLYSQLLSEADEVREIGKKRRVDLLSKTPRLAKVGINGKAQRVDQAKTSFQSSNQHVDLSMASKPSQSPTEEGDKSIQQTVPKVSTVPKVAKMDLSYILNWDPDARRCNSQNETELNLASGVSENKPSVEKIDEEPSRAGFSTTSSVSTCSSSLNSAPPSPSRCTQEGQPENKVRIDRSSRPDTAALIAKANPEFLPLVTESNILRVNGKPFLKLNVIGSGGSCKVYRALSKDCSVVAIKRVKIDGIDLKTVDGYANEIALLKRLRCNPAIIEMIDSEVDLARKSIFLVLELGEIDLNQAIQQQVGRGGSNASGSRLNMNFIRLTWQQMLQAVHCIHEERIIHGDLKPANFLFVRGVLKLIDFGIAKAIQSEDTTNIYRDDSIIGTLNYLSPEAIQNTGSDKNSNRMKIGRVSRLFPALVEILTVC